LYSSDSTPLERLFPVGIHFDVFRARQTVNIFVIPLAGQRSERAVLFEGSEFVVDGFDQFRVSILFV
jgi:hypothetical protein